MLAHTALKYDVEVKTNGQVELIVPFPPGEHVTIYVMQAGESFNDLINAAENNLGFWDNSLDDEDWNHA